MSSKVFVGHEVTVMDGNKLRPKFNMSHAAQFGELVYVFANQDIVLTPVSAKAEILRVFERHDLNVETDYFLMAGSPAVIAFMVEVAQREWDGVPRLLSWDRFYKRYHVLGG